MDKTVDEIDRLQSAHAIASITAPAAPAASLDRVKPDILQPMPRCEVCGSAWTIRRADHKMRCRRCGTLSDMPEPVSDQLSFVAYSLRDEK